MEPQASIEPAQKKQKVRSSKVAEDTAKVEPVVKTKKKKTVSLLESFHLTAAFFTPLLKTPKCNLVPLSLIPDSSKKCPVLVQMNGGGSIPENWGIEDKEQDGRRKVQIALQINCVEDHSHLDRLRTELGEIVVQHWKGWFPDAVAPSDEMIMNSCNNFVTPRKKKKNSEGSWAGCAKASIDPEEGKCIIVDKETGEAVPFADLPGMVWHKAIFELKWVFILATKSYGITKKLAYLQCSSGEDEDVLEPL
jgi:hypothetical protein